MKGPSRPYGSTVMGMRMISFCINSPVFLSPSILSFFRVAALLSCVSFDFPFFYNCSLVADVTVSIIFTDPAENQRVQQGGVIVTSPPMKEYSQVAEAAGEGLG